MPFQGADPYGTSSTHDTLALPQSPEDIRIAVGGNHVAFLLVNGPVTIRLRETIENVVRVIGGRGEGTVALIIRDDGAVIDSNLVDVNAVGGISVTAVSPGVVSIQVPASGITEAMLGAAIVTATKIATGAVGATQLASNAVTTAKIAAAAVTPDKFGTFTYTAEDTTMSTLADTSASTVFLSAPTMSLPAGDFVFIAVGRLSGQGGAATNVDGAVEVRRNGVVRGTTGTIRLWEQGVDGSQVVTAMGTVSSAAAWTADWDVRFNRTGGTFSPTSGDLYVFMLQYA